MKQRSFEYRIARLGLLTASVPLALCLALLYSSSISFYLKIILLLTVVASVTFGGFFIWRKVRDQLIATTSVIEAVISNDSTMKAHSGTKVGALAELNKLLNNASKILAEQRLVSKEHHLAMAKVIEHIQVAVLCVDPNGRITLVNPKGKEMFGVDDSFIGLPVEKVMAFEQPEQKPKQGQVVSIHRQGLSKRVYLQTDSYQLLGQTHSLYLINDVQKLLQEEERIAWQKLIRVLRHEINNSLAPIASISESLSDLVSDGMENGELKQDLTDGLSVVMNRALSLESFIKQYQTLSRLPKPEKQLFELRPFVLQQIEGMSNAPIKLFAESDIEIFADPNQLSQVFANLLKNAQQAITESDGQISINWHLEGSLLQIRIKDNGQGISNPDNLFVPFYTTKDQGNGIGLVLSRQIMFNHGGDLSLTNNAKQTGATACIQLPVVQSKVVNI